MKLYILEDETNILQYIISIAEKLPYIQLVGYSDTVSKAAKEIPELNPELILADIQLKDSTSFQLFSQIDCSGFQIIFNTAFENYAIQALNIGAMAYLLKPIDEDNLTQALEKCFAKKEAYKFNNQQAEIAAAHFAGNGAMIDKIALRCLEYIQIVQIDEILYCQSDKGYTTFFLKDNTRVMVSKPLKDYEDILITHQFLRCHQSYLVNLNYVKKYFKEGDLLMENDLKIPVATRKKDLLLEYLRKLG